MGLLTVSLSAFAQSGDAMKQDSMKQDDSVKKDDMKKDKKSKKKAKKDEAERQYAERGNAALTLNSALGAARPRHNPNQNETRALEPQSLRPHY